MGLFGKSHQRDPKEQVSQRIGIRYQIYRAISLSNSTQTYIFTTQNDLIV